jgi:hypothetical protein
MRGPRNGFSPPESFQPENDLNVRSWQLYFANLFWNALDLLSFERTAEKKQKNNESLSLAEQVILSFLGKKKQS